MAARILGRAQVEGGRELLLVAHSGGYTIRIDGAELMSSSAHRSEEALAREVAERLAGVSDVRILVGGLGMGFTVRALLDALPDDARLVVAEVVPEVVEWCRGPLAPFCGGALRDPRVQIHTCDVRERVTSVRSRWHAVVLDVDNGPAALSLTSNEWLYSTQGLAALYDALHSGGVLAVWSAAADGGFDARLRATGFAVEVAEVAPREGENRVKHCLYLARRSDSGAAT